MPKFHHLPTCNVNIGAIHDIVLELMHCFVADSVHCGIVFIFIIFSKKCLVLGINGTYLFYKLRTMLLKIRISVLKFSFQFKIFTALIEMVEKCAYLSKTKRCIEATTGI